MEQKALFVAKHLAHYMSRSCLVQDPTLLGALTADLRLPAEVVMNHPAFCQLEVTTKELLDAAQLIDKRIVDVDLDDFTLIPKLGGIRNVLLFRDLTVSLQDLRQVVLNTPSLAEQKAHEDRQEPLQYPWLASRPSWHKLLSQWTDGDLAYAEFSDEAVALQVAQDLQALTNPPFKVAVKSMPVYTPQSVRGALRRLTTRNEDAHVGATKSFSYPVFDRNSCTSRSRGRGRHGGGRAVRPIPPTQPPMKMLDADFPPLESDVTARTQQPFWKVLRPVSQ